MPRHKLDFYNTIFDAQYTYELFQEIKNGSCIRIRGTKLNVKKAHFKILYSDAKNETSEVFLATDSTFKNNI
jgi:hypothetical protein